MKAHRNELIILDRFVSDVSDSFKEVKNNTEYLNLTDNQQEKIEKAFQIIKAKIKKMKNSESIVELSEHVKVKKVLKERRDDE